MAKKTSRRGRRRKSDVNKAHEIRSEFERQGGEARPRDVIAALAAKGVEVSSAQVSNVKKALAGGGAVKAKPGRKKTSRASSDAVSLDTLLEAKRLAERLGGVDAAKRALDVLSRLV